MLQPPASSLSSRRELVEARLCNDTQARKVCANDEYRVWDWTLFLSVWFSGALCGRPVTIGTPEVKLRAES